jgi:hypothetical protein
MARVNAAKVMAGVPVAALVARIDVMPYECRIPAM